jgi:hypothetical protein
MLGLLLIAALVAACGPGPTLATFTREWGDGRVETLTLYEDGRVLMDHVGFVDRVTLPAEDVNRLRTAMRDLRPTPDATTFPRLTLTPTGGTAVVVDSEPGTAGGLFTALLDRHALPAP